MHTCAGPDLCDVSYRPKQVLTAEWLNVCKMGKAPFAPYHQFTLGARKIVIQDRAIGGG